jgi:cysteine desulfurase
MVVMMLANNETGAVQPVQEVCAYCRQHNVLFATDAAQATGKISIVVEDLGHPDMVTIVGHKLGAPKGIGCLYIRPGCLDPYIAVHPIHGLLLGGGQEYNWRGGTSNVPYIVGFGVAAEHAAKHMVINAQHMECMRRRLVMRLTEALGEQNVRVHGPIDPKHRLPNTLSIGFGNGIHSAKLLHDVRNVVAASAGAACHSKNGPISAILKAMNVPDDWARGTVRLSLGPHTTADEVDRAAVYLAEAVQHQWKESEHL